MLIVGSNLFGQWQANSDCYIVDNFHHPILKTNEGKLNLNLEESKLVHIGWSYNILLCEGEFYVTGTWKEKDSQLVQLQLPEECNNTPEIKYTMVANEQSIILINIECQTMWVLDFETDYFRKINLVLENLSDNLSEIVKKPRKDKSILRAMITNTSGIFLTADGHVYWGLLPTLLDTSHCEGTVCDVQCGYDHFVLLTDVGKVFTWGNGRRLQLGHDDLISLESPKLVQALAGIKITKIRAGGWHTLALSEFGDLYAWGWNDIGQLGVKDSGSNHETSRESVLKSQPSPVLVDFYDDDKLIELNVKDIACGSRHSVALLENNSVWSTGNNHYGQCGFPSESQAVVKYFKRCYSCERDHKLLGGPWATVLLK